MKRPCPTTFSFLYLLANMLFATSYFIGITVFEIQHVPTYDEYFTLSILVKMLCFVNILLLGFGFILLKNNNFYQLLSFLYSAMSGIIVPLICIYGCVRILNMKTPTSTTLTDLLLQDWRDHKIHSSWMENAENEENCCGISSWKDYRLIIYESRPPVPYLDVPYPCCKELPTFTETGFHCLNSSIPFVLFFDFNDHPFQQKFDVRTESEKAIEYSAYKTTELNFPFINPEYADLINAKGCKPFLLRKLVIACAVNFAVLLYIGISDLIMLLIYVKSWLADNLAKQRIIFEETSRCERVSLIA